MINSRSDWHDLSSCAVGRAHRESAFGEAANDLLPALATRAGGEVVPGDF